MEKTERINRWLLFLAGTILLSLAFLMKLFPVFIFFGLAPLFALSAQASEDTIWENTELILLSLAIGFFCSEFFEVTTLPKSTALAVIFSIPFLLFAFVRQNLGRLTGTMLIIFFWLSLEYLMLKTGLPRMPLFLADTLISNPKWATWTAETGYLGISLWILTSNWIFSLGLKAGGIKWFWILAGILITVVPIGYSFYLPGEMIDRDFMLNVYKGTATIEDQLYFERGEWIARTAAWISVLIVLVAAVRGKISDKSGTKK